LSLDDGDNDPVRFLAYLVAALQTVEPEVGAAVLDALQAPGIGDEASMLAVESILAPLINEIASLSGRFLLFLDDYHLIKAQPIHNALAFLFDHLPGQMHLTVASRSDPPLPLARLRGRGLLTEIREADLRFTPAEAAAFLNTATGLDLAAADIAALEARTEGWITGLQLAAISMQGRDANLVSSFVKAFTGSNRYVLDYLTEEVLQRQPKYVQSFLLQTSILNRLSGPLCDAVLGEVGQWDSGTVGDWVDSQRMLEYLESNNLFVMPLDDERLWYRYHRLFADLLRVRLGEAHPDRVPELHQRVSVWYEVAGAIDDAVTHAVEGETRRALAS
jgi:LuxR family maltose regulon positive regulatory protein